MEPEAEPLSYILNYYRDRIENNEEERRKWYDTLGKLSIPQDYDHTLRWEYKKRTEEMLELQTAVKDAHYALHDYREDCNKLKEDNDNLIVRENENQKLIQDLLALNNSVEQHVHFSEGKAPDILLSYSKNAQGQNINQRDKENYSGNMVGPNDAPKKNMKFRVPEVLRTVFLENSDILELSRELEELQKEVLEEKYIFDQQLTQARNEKAQLDEYARQELISDNDKITKLIQ